MRALRRTLALRAGLASAGCATDATDAPAPLPLARRAVQAFALANADFFAAVGDYTRARFRPYRALGHPGQCLAGAGEPAQPAPPPGVPSK